MYRVDQVIYNILVTKDLHKNVFDYIYTWGETLAYIVWTIRASYHCHIRATSIQAVNDIDTIFNSVVVVNWQVITANNQRQVDIDDVCKNARQVRHNYIVGYLVYVDMTSVYHKLDYKKYGPYRII